MTVILAFLAKHWRLVAYAVAAAVAVWFLLLVRHWRNDSTVDLPKAEAALKLEVECGVGSECAARLVRLEEQQRAISAKVSQEYHDEIDALNARPITRRVIRVCAPPDNLRDAPVAGGTGTGTAPGGLVHGADEFDTRPLFDLARRADQLSAQTRAIIHRDQALSQPPK